MAVNNATIDIDSTAEARPRPRAAYVHVPFCRHRCGYCDFAIVAGRDDLIDGFITAIAKEMTRLDGMPVPGGAGGVTECGPPSAGLDLATLYLGGGTPSHLGPDGLRRLFDILHTRLRPIAAAEVTIEANPSDVTASLAIAAADCGTTRVSLGAQSLDANTLAALDRDHTPDDVRRAVGILLDRGFTVSVDLMTAAPGQTLADVDRDLEAIAALGTQHLSVYCLTWEKGTSFDSQRRRGAIQPVSESLERAMLELTIDRLEAAGFEHYEVSNFARPGGRCLHNETYWDCRPWEAFGPGAARFDGRVRTTNHRSPTTWLRRVLSGGDFTGDRDVMTPLEAAQERIVLGLRRRDGLARAAFLNASGIELDAVAGDSIGRWTDRGLATDDGEHVRLTREGLLVSDSLWADVLRPA